MQRPEIARRAVAAPRPAPSRRRRALGLILANGVLWSIGNGLTSGQLVSYLAQELGAGGWDVGLLLALPALVGLLRVTTPLVIGALGGARRTTLSFFALAYALLAAAPAIAWGTPLPGQVAPVAALIAVVCLHQLCESIASAALWAWLAELVPRRVRGRFFARRQVWQMAVLIPTLLASGYASDRGKRAATVAAPVTLGTAQPRIIAAPGTRATNAGAKAPRPASDRGASNRAPTRGYAWVLGVGAVVLASSIAPLAWLPPRWGPARSATRRTGASRPVAEGTCSAGDVAAQAVAQPWRDRRFWWLLAFGCWVAWFNGLTQSAQNIFPRAVLRFDLLPLQFMQTMMRLGQMSLGPWVGRASDRHGCRPVIILCQLVTALGPLFFALATPDRRWTLVGAWLSWSAFVGLNVCLPNLMLKLSGGRDRGAGIAGYFGLTTGVYAVASLVGGGLLDAGRGGTWHLVGGSCDTFAVLFGLGFLGRLAAVLWLLPLEEPGARRWKEIVADFRRRRGATTT